MLGTAVPPAASIAATVSRARSASTPLTTTAAPDAAAGRANACPSPRPAPVMTTARPPRSAMLTSVAREWSGPQRSGLPGQPHLERPEPLRAVERLRALVVRVRLHDQFVRPALPGPGHERGHERFPHAFATPLGRDPHAFQRRPHRAGAQGADRQ